MTIPSIEVSNEGEFYYRVDVCDASNSLVEGKVYCAGVGNECTEGYICSICNGTGMCTHKLEHIGVATVRRENVSGNTVSFGCAFCSGTGVTRWTAVPYCSKCQERPTDKTWTSNEYPIRKDVVHYNHDSVIKKQFFDLRKRTSYMS